MKRVIATAMFLCLVLDAALIPQQFLDNNGFEVANALTSVRNGDRSVTYFCERREIYLTGSLRGELRVKDIGDGKVKVVYSDGICKVNNCNLPPMMNMVYDLSTGFNSGCRAKNVNTITLPDGNTTCAWLKPDCNRSTYCDPNNPKAIVRNITSEYMVAKLLCKYYAHVRFYCHRYIPDVWYVRSYDKNYVFINHLVTKISCDSKISCGKPKIIARAHYTIRGRQVTYSCFSGSEPSYNVDTFSCNEWSGKWGNINFECTETYRGPLNFRNCFLLLFAIFIMMGGCGCLCKGSGSRPKEEDEILI